MESTQSRLLVTGFGAFHEFDRNPSQDIAITVNGQYFHQVQVIGQILPVSWKLAWPILFKSILQNKPSGLLMLGLAPGHWFRFERFAINRNMPYLDKDNNHPLSQEIVANGADQLESALPLDWLYEQIQKNSTLLSNELCYSEDAGGFICNNVFYNALNHLDNIVPWRGFIHVPEYLSTNVDIEAHKNEIINVGTDLVERFSFWLSQKQSIAQSV